MFTVLSFFLLSCSFALGQLSSNQTNTMFTLSQLLSSSVPSWDVKKEPNPCLWKGVICSNSVITRLSLSGYGISSSEFLPVVCQLVSLQSLDVSSNQLSSVPNEFMQSCGGIGGLNLLNFSKNELVSLPTFSGFVGLEFLDLSYNNLEGNITLQFHDLFNLKSLNLSRNRFNGFLPINLGKGKGLEELQLAANAFRGEIPGAIADYRNLTLIDLSVNHLSGSIPDRIGELSKLEILILSANNLNGRIPAALANITKLSRFAANQNKFSGSIPGGITRFLRSIDLSYNNLSGVIPLDLLSHTNLQTVDFSFNLLEGSVPENISSSLVRLRLGSNKLIGVIPSASFASLDKLTYLELDNNSFHGMIPQELGNCRNLTLLNLARNRLNGSLPTKLASLGKLQVMELQLNKLNGEIPIQFSQLKQLSTMNISWNSLSGSIPSQFSILSKLAKLYLQHNNLSGPIPNSITNMQSLIELQLGENQFSGMIPEMPSALQIALNLSNNLFEGSIPNSLSRLAALEVLDLSNNNFSGEVPVSLTRMSALTQLILSNNQLSGIVPRFGRWVSVKITGTELIYPKAPVPDTSPRAAKSRKSVAVPIVIALAAAILAVVLVTIIAISISRRFYRVNDEHLQLGEGISSPKVFQGKLLTANGIHRSNIDFTKALEATANPLNTELKTRFSTYYKAVMPSGMSYFVKKLNWSDKKFRLGSHGKFEKELEVLGKLNNSNVMTPLAYSLASDNGYLFYEYAPTGNLFDVLHGSLENALDWSSRYSIAVGVAQGLAFLHGFTSNPILLLDLSSRNIFLKSPKEPQIGDIELCKVIDPSKSTGSLSTVAGSVGYIPPEYAYTMRVTMAGNVYSFGVILLELLTGKAAVSEGKELAKWVLPNSTQQDKLERILDGSVSRTSLPVKSQMLAVLKVAVACVGVSPEARPNMKSVLRMLLNAR